MVQIPAEARHDILNVCRRLYERGLVAGTDGNVSIRLSREHLLATPTGMSKGFIESDDLVVCDMQGRQIAGKRRLTTEIKIHLAVYEQRDEVCAVVHAHPPFATAFAVARKSMDESLMPEAYIAVGKVALAPYGTPSTAELEESIRPAVVDHDSILLSNHGAMTLGRDVLAAYHRMEALEQLARISAIAQHIGGPTTLSAEQMQRLDAIRSVYGNRASKEPCYNCGWAPGTPSSHASEAGPPAAGVSDDARPAPQRPKHDAEPRVHWSGNPPVWRGSPAPSSPSAADERDSDRTPVTEAQVRDLARRALQEIRQPKPGP